MRKMGKFSVKGMKELQKDLEKLQAKGNQQFIEECAKELAARLLAKLIKNTPQVQVKKAVHFAGVGQRSDQRALM